MKKIGWTYLMIMILLFATQYVAISMSGTQYSKANEVKRQEEGQRKQKKQQKVRVYFHKEKKEVEMELEDYIIGVVCAEMPSSYNSEALKAQAVAARTYTYVRMQDGYTPKDEQHANCAVCSDFAHCQAYVSKESVMKDNGKVVGRKKWRKIQRAVEDTAGEIITYSGKIANPLFHASSGGMTEDAALVWGGKSVPYLKSVKSGNEEGYAGYKETVELDKKEALAKLKVFDKDFSAEKEKIDLEDIKIDKRSKSNRVLEMSILGRTFSGTQVRAAWGLRSTMLYVVETEKDLLITTLGYGHGVGMSQYGANAMAKSGGSYKEILKHYYTGVKLENLKNK